MPWSNFQNFLFIVSLSLSDFPLRNNKSIRIDRERRYTYHLSVPSKDIVDYHFIVFFVFFSFFSGLSTLRMNWPIHC